LSVPSGKDGIQLNSASGISIIGNYIYHLGTIGNGSIGIKCAGISNSNLISGNQIANADTGILLEESDHTVVGNHIIAWTEGITQTGGAKNIAIGNRIVLNGGANAINVTGGSMLAPFGANYSTGAFIGCGARIDKHAILTDGATVDVDASLGNYFTLTAAGSRTIASPTNPLDGQEADFVIFNNTAGAITTTWSGAANGFLKAGAWVDPAAGKRRSIRYRYDTTTNMWTEIARGAADM
jgi:hypothetical protein